MLEAYTTLATGVTYRNLAQILKTLGAPVMLADNEGEASELAQRLAPEVLERMGRPNRRRSV